MSFLKRFLTNSAGQPDSETPTRSAKKLTQLAIFVAIAGTILFVPLGTRGLAKGGQQAEAKPDANAASNIDPDAIDAIKKMAAYLHTLKSYQIIDDVTQAAAPPAVAPGPASTPRAGTSAKTRIAITTSIATTTST
jgi:hypothetical protein